MLHVLLSAVALTLTGGQGGHPTGGDGINCTGTVLPPGQCWSDRAQRVSNNPGTTSAECCALCSATPTCRTWVFWGHPGTYVNCTLFKGSAPTAKCTSPPALTIVGRVPPPPPTPPPPPPPPAPVGAKDVLMIAIDDLRPELEGNAYGCRHMKTPHFAEFAADAVVFDHAYVAVAWCSPSRTALLTSRRPDSTRTSRWQSERFSTQARCESPLNLSQSCCRVPPLCIRYFTRARPKRLSSVLCAISRVTITVECSPWRASR
jgi:hypothetical protein